MHPKQLFFLSLIAVGFYQLVGFTATLHPVSGSILGYASNITVSEVIVQTNTQRAASGLRELTFNQQLTQAATAKAQNMFSNNYWAHTSPDGTQPWDFIKSAGYTYKIAGENLARDFDSTSPMVSAWMASPTHRANIMNPRYEEIGVAVVDGLLDGVETTLVVQMFGTPTSQEVAQQPSVAVPAVATKPQVQAEQDIQEADEPQEPANIPVRNDLQEAELSLPTPTPAVGTQQDRTQSPEPVLAESVVPEGRLSDGILYSPKHVLKAFFLSIIIVLLAVLFYDAVVAGHKDSVRFVGKNVAHILLLLVVAYLIIAFRGGVVGP